MLTYSLADYSSVTVSKQTSLTIYEVIAPTNLQDLEYQVGSNELSFSFDSFHVNPDLWPAEYFLTLVGGSELPQMFDYTFQEENKLLFSVYSNSDSDVGTYHIKV